MVVSGPQEADMGGLLEPRASDKPRQHGETLSQQNQT